MAEPVELEYRYLRVLEARTPHMFATCGDDPRPRSPNLNAHAETYVRSAREECLSRLVLLGEAGFRRALAEFLAHYHKERNHQGKGNALLFPSAKASPENGPIECKQRLGGMLKYYHRKAA